MTYEQFQSLKEGEIVDYLHLVKGPHGLEIRSVNDRRKVLKKGRSHITLEAPMNASGRVRVENHLRVDFIKEQS